MYDKFTFFSNKKRSKNDECVGKNDIISYHELMNNQTKKLQVKSQKY